MLIFFIRMFVPESEKWRHEHVRGADIALGESRFVRGFGRLPRIARDHLGLDARRATSRPGGGDHDRGAGGGAWLATSGLCAGIWSSRLRAACGRLVNAKSLGGMALVQMPAGVALLGTWGSVQWAP